ncbi:MAG: hypothetical protein GY703_09705 [Gammaproteobacteria bacterium]|nr:hypothetical protein [Gammaproteobacteria bacterium]
MDLGEQPLYVTLSTTQKNLSGTEFHASPKGEAQDEPSNLGQKTSKIGYFMFSVALSLKTIKVQACTVDTFSYDVQTHIDK